MYKNKFWIFQKVLDEKTCNKIIEAGLSEKKQKAKIGKKNNLIKKIRTSKVVWLEHQWLYDLIFQFANIGNINAQWNLKYDWAEPCQFTSYEKNDFYAWHCDSLSEPYSIDHKFENFREKNRKLSMSICLSDKKDFTGGDFQFDFRDRSDGKPNIKTIKEIKEKGSILIFPSNLFHRITPVKKGIRYSLVSWFLGEPFR